MARMMRGDCGARNVSKFPSRKRCTSLGPSVPIHKSPFDATMALPYHLFVISTQVPEMPIQIQYGTALVLLVFVLRLINDRGLMGSLRNSRVYNLLGWGTFLLITLAVVIMLGTQILGLLGILPR